MDMHAPHHMSSAPSYSHPASAAPMQHYPQYQPQPVMQPSSAHYGPPPTYSSYGYPNGVTSPQSAGGHIGPGVQSQNIQLPAMSMGGAPQHAGYPPQSTPSNQQYPANPYDPTGQNAPPGMKPRVTATLWEDEGSLCFQVEAKGVCVARREDNHFINGTKLLNVAGMTRGRRDGILKSEKTRHVVKIGPMHLKGVWIPFERALEFANREKITDLLYPLFVHNIGGLLYNPESAPRTNNLVAATTERRRMDSIDGGRPPSSSGGAPPLHHHHSMSGPIPGQAPPTPHSIAPNPNAGRPGLDRAHTFPTPPTSASSVMGMGNSGGPGYEWGAQPMANGVNGAQPLSIDTGINARSMPTTPATTPPSQSQQNMQGYQGQPGYDTKATYNTPGSVPGYPPQSDARYGQPPTYTKSEMGPPSAPGAAPLEAHDGSHGQGHEHDAGHGENGYMSSNAAAYGASRAYSYNPASDHPHLSPEMTGSPHQAASGRGTPRTMPPAQAGWGAHDYQTPPRGSTSSNVYNVMGNTNSSNGPSSDGAYPSSAYSGTGMQSAKRGREDDDQDRPGSRDFDFKRQKTGPVRQEPFGMPLNAPHMQAIKTGGQR